MSKKVVRAHNKLAGDLVSRKKRFKLYKSGRQWLIAGAVVASLAGISISNANDVKADTVDDSNSVTKVSGDTTPAAALQKNSVTLNQGNKPATATESDTAAQASGDATQQQTKSASSQSDATAADSQATADASDASNSDSTTEQQAQTASQVATPVKSDDATADETNTESAGSTQNKTTTDASDTASEQSAQPETNVQPTPAPKVKTQVDAVSATKADLTASSTQANAKVASAAAVADTPTTDPDDFVTHPFLLEYVDEDNGNTIIGTYQQESQTVFGYRSGDIKITNGVEPKDLFDIYEPDIAKTVHTDGTEEDMDGK